MGKVLNTAQLITCTNLLTFFANGLMNLKRTINGVPILKMINPALKKKTKTTDGKLVIQGLDNLQFFTCTK